MSNIISEQDLKNKYNGDCISGVILMGEVVRGTTKNGKPFYSGTLTSGEQVSYKVWDSTLAFETLRQADLSGHVVDIEGTWNEYQGTWSIIINRIVDLGDGTSSGVGVSDFLKSRYDIPSYWAGLLALMKQNLTDNGYKVADKILFSNPDVAEQFKYAFAAKSHHDNCKGGLLAHTYKICYLANVFVNLYPSMVDKDLLYLGCLLHDIGKVREMDMGVYQEVSKVTHRFLGIEMLDKDLIVSIYGESFYYELVSILLQHHGEYADPCKTVSSYIVHLIDCIESRFMGLVQNMELSDNCGKVNVDGSYLSYPTLQE